MKNRTPYCLIIVWVLLFAFAVTGCIESVDTDPKNLIGRWQMVKVVHQGNTFSKPDLSGNDREVEIEFLKNERVEGTIPWESFSGDYKISAEDSISIKCWKSSKMGMPDWGDYFFHNINQVTTFSLKKRKISIKYEELHLNYEDGQLIFNKVK
ncbi:hypothetical protein LZD49_14895 [Dyadobacter sp. CY261]|uniref:hypothetical protein n=1 Tax=Dyadobacter sp. CY261 TaxID=2907203 RepID=UPI001F1DE599|nr:hypothetical protein [Dyadobacter sp. CY261]MCF0071763.1 hypothetical protein [Dyadobacter sp. CY261]